MNEPTMKKEAEKAWHSFASKRYGHLLPDDKRPRVISYMTGIEDFYASLREKIEKEIKELESMIEWEGAVDLPRYSAKLAQSKYILQLLDTVTPTSTQGD